MIRTPQEFLDALQPYAGELRLLAPTGLIRDKSQNHCPITLLATRRGIGDIFYADGEDECSVTAAAQALEIDPELEELIIDAADHRDVHRPMRRELLALVEHPDQRVIYEEPEPDPRDYE